MADELRVLALSKKNEQLRAVVAYRADEVIWIFGGPDERHLGYVQLVRLWPNTSLSNEPTSEEVAEAVARFGKQRADDIHKRRIARFRS